MKTLTKILIGTGALVVAAGGVAYARGPMGCGGPGMGMGMDGPGPMMQRMFDRVDADKDGAVTLKEIVAEADARFDRIDADKNGVIDKAEVESWVGRFAPPQAAAFFLAKHDLDGDGKITKAEWENPVKKRFAIFDRNDDGKVTRDEMQLAAPMRGHGRHHAAMGGWGGPGMGGPGMGMGGPGMGMGGPGWNQPGQQPAPTR